MQIFMDFLILQIFMGFMQGYYWRFLKRQFMYRKRTDRVDFPLEYSPKVYQSTE